MKQWMQDERPQGKKRKKKRGVDDFVIANKENIKLHEKHYG